MIFDHCSKRNYWSVKWLSDLSFPSLTPRTALSVIQLFFEIFTRLVKSQRTVCVNDFWFPCSNLAPQQRIRDYVAIHNLHWELSRKSPNIVRHPLHEVEVYREKRSDRDKSYPDMILRHSCRYFLEEICTISSCAYWPPERQFCIEIWDVKQETSFPHYKFEEQSNKRQKKSCQNGKAKSNKL